ncbi:MAG TPA: universal stress protein [Vicinamibacteria bacterium]|nr:universal stress protein [Vicinamibacteria bacterium]
MRVLLCVDEDPVLDSVLAAFDWSIATGKRDELLVLHVSGQAPLFLASRDAKPRKDTEALFSRVADRLSHLPFGIKKVTARGEPAHAIVRVAEEHEVDLIVIGARGERRDFLLGSVSEKVVSLADTDVLVVRARDGEDKTERSFHALVAVDGSAGSEAGIGSFVEKLRAPQAEIRLVHVIDALPGLWEVGSMEGPFSASLAGHARDVLSRALDLLRRRGLDAECEWRHGSPATQILDVARTGRADLIVVGSRGQSKLRGLLLGTITQRVVRHAPCSVLCARGFAPESAALSAPWFCDDLRPGTGLA